MSERRMRYKCHRCGRVWYQDFDPGPRVGVMGIEQGLSGFTYGLWGPRCPTGHDPWHAKSSWEWERFTDRTTEPEWEVFV